MKLGLCLEGGGAKGAFQAGVIKALYDKGINKFYSISGTSIGAANGYAVFTGNACKLENMWKNMSGEKEKIQIINNTVDNSILLDRLKNMYDENKKVSENFYVNYVQVKNKDVSEIIVNLKNLSEEECLENVKYSSNLPYSKRQSGDFRKDFIDDVVDGIYEGGKLDGGILNNSLIQPLIEDEVDKIILITMRHNYVVQENIKNIYDENKIIAIGPEIPFEAKDTMRFEEEFCKVNFEKGYEIGSKKVAEILK
ncbi:MAG: patatin-like phospholipase family protein [Clostridioides sp.]|nr:patatin-like phospholipase family protein [Clostridioides sp.]